MVTTNQEPQMVLYIALELAQKDTLFEYITSSKKAPLKEAVAAHLFKQILKGV